MSYLGWFLICIGEGILFSVCFVLAAHLLVDRRAHFVGLFLIIEIATVWILYRDKEMVWPFFVHPYLSLMILNIADYIFLKRDKFEKFFLWPFYVLPAMSGFVMVWGWIFKIRAISELFNHFK